MSHLNDEALVSVKDAEAFLKIGHDKQTPLLEDLINDASAMCDLETGRNLAARTYTALNPIGDPSGHREMLLAHRPVNSVTEIRSFSPDLSSSDVVDSADYKLFGDAGIIMLVGGWRGFSGGWSEAHRVCIHSEKFRYM